MDLVKEIISRVPLNTMRAVRLTCKKWDTLSKNRSFSKMYIDKAAAAAKEGESKMIMLMDYDLHLMSVTVNEKPTTQPLGQLICLNEQVKISKVIHCEGLLLCILIEDTRLVVWNPYSGQTRWIESRYSRCAKYKRYKDRYQYWYALGYVNDKNKSCCSYKILRFLNGSDYAIYDFNSDLWRTLDLTPTPNWHISLHQPFGVSIKGNTYWCATKTYSQDKLNDHIICFDFAKERFGRLLRLPFCATWHDFVTLSCVREQKLAVLLQRNEAGPYEIEIWITTKIEAEKLLWCKLLTLYMEPPSYPFLSTIFFIDEEKKVAVCFDENNCDHILSIVGEAGYLKQLTFGKRVDISSHICSYVPSLVKIKQTGGGKRKMQSSLETRRFDEKKYRGLLQLKSQSMSDID